MDDHCAIVVLGDFCLPHYNDLCVLSWHAVFAFYYMYIKGQYFEAVLSQVKFKIIQSRHRGNSVKAIQ